MTPARTAVVAQAFRTACALDVAVQKPGNVSVASPGHRMTAELFLASAEAAACPLCRFGARVGDRIEAAMAATWRVAGCNTNLGILLLCAPLASAAEVLDAPIDPERLRRAVGDVLARLDRDDAAAAFRAIALANPAGLGRADREDVHAAPTQDLRAAMTLAADRDRVARQYRDGYDDLFGLGLGLGLGPGLGLGLGLGPGPGPGPGPGRRPEALVADAVGLEYRDAIAPSVQRLYLTLLAAHADSHIVRKLGAATADAVLREAQPWAARAAAGERLGDDPAYAAWDESLKRRGINPGTTADLTVATLMIAFLTGALPLPLQLPN